MIALVVPTVHMAVGITSALVALVLITWLLVIVLQECGHNRVPCLLYHRFQRAGDVRPPGDLDPIYVCHESRFAEQMSYLRDMGYTTLTMDDLMMARCGRLALPSKPVIITFDDGFASNYDVAFPILKENGQRATIFVTPDRESANFKAVAHLDRPLTDAEIREMVSAGIDIQSHGLTHRFFTELDDPELRRELVESRSTLAAITSRPIRYLAIPGGAYDARVRRMVRECGYEAVFCMRKGSVGLKADPLRLPRMVVGRDMRLQDFRALLRPGGWVRGRIVSGLQQATVRTLGMRRADKLRNWLYASTLAPLLSPRLLAWLLILVAAALIAASLVVLLFPWH